MSLKVILENCRLSYPALFKPKESNNGGAAKYQATILIPKSDTKALNAVNAALQAEWAAATQPSGAWKGLNPQSPKITLYDGDTAMPSGEAWGAECQGHMVLRTSSSNAPDVVDEYGNKAMDATKFYAGCYCHFSVVFAAYDNSGQKGIGAFLNCVMFAGDGDPLEAKASAKNDFASLIAARANAAPVGGFGAPAAPAMPGFPGAQAPVPAMPQTPYAGAPVQAQASPVAPTLPGMPSAMPAQQPPAGFGGFPGGFGGFGQQ